MKKIFALAAIMLGLNAFAQDPNNVEMADVMRSNGKIYVVIAILVVIFVGMIIYLVNIDRKVSKLEKEIKK